MDRPVLATPSGDKSTLIWPPVATWVERATRQHARDSSVLLAGIPLQEQRRSARRELIEVARAYLSESGESLESWPDPASPLVLFGHQPELYHPGVWIKSPAAFQLASKLGGWSVHVLIDNDTIKHSAIRVPVGGPSQYIFGYSPFDQWTGEIPYEDREVMDEEVFQSFADRTTYTMDSVLKNWREPPILADYWSRVRAVSEVTDNLGRRLALGRHQLEKSWGWRNIEVPLSQLCETSAFRSLAAGVLADRTAFRAVYNDAILEYRRRHGVRSQHHPAALLVEHGEWTETPFWIWHEDLPRRLPLFVRTAHHEATLRMGADGDEFHFSFDPSTPQASFERILEECQETRIRPRALLTTIYLRVLLADWFIHGIGGGKYDEVTDVIIARYFQLEPPEFGVLSATLLLPNAATTDFDAQARRVRTEARRMHWNPDLYLDDVLRERNPVADWIEQKHDWIQRETPGRDDRRRRAKAIRAINDQLRPYVASEMEARQREARQLAEASQSHRVLGSRDYPFCLYPESSLRDLFASVRF